MTFISFEGIEGAGKSTQAKRAVEWLQSKGHDVLYTREPGGTPIAERLRTILLTPTDEVVTVYTELLLMFAARSQHIENVIRPALKQGRMVVCDRFVDATYAYQGGGRHVALEVMDALSRTIIGDLMPDCTILLDITVDEGMRRAESRGAPADRFEGEQKQFFERIRNVYLERAKQDPKRIQIVNAAQDLETVTENVLNTISKML